VSDAFPYLPIEDEVSAPFWAATRERRLLIQFCPECARFQHYPRAICTQCGGTFLEWKEPTGKATIDSWTLIARAPSEGFEAPYYIIRARLEENVIMLSRFVGKGEPKCDMPVILGWQSLSDGRHLPVFISEQEQ